MMRGVLLNALLKGHSRVGQISPLKLLDLWTCLHDALSFRGIGATRLITSASSAAAARADKFTHLCSPPHGIPRKSMGHGPGTWPSPWLWGLTYRYPSCGCGLSHNCCSS